MSEAKPETQPETQPPQSGVTGNDTINPVTGDAASETEPPEKVV